MLRSVQRLERRSGFRARLYDSRSRREYLEYQAIARIQGTEGESQEPPPATRGARGGGGAGVVEYTTIPLLEARLTRTKAWVVEFAGCQEAVIRTGESLEDVNYPDDLGCPAVRIRPLHEVALKPGPMNLWMKGGELRCEIL